jgi:hypothetical protein
MKIMLGREEAFGEVEEVEALTEHRAAAHASAESESRMMTAGCLLHAGEKGLGAASRLEKM